MKKSMLILTTAFVCLVICSFPVFGQGTTYVETRDIYQYSVGGTITWSHTYDHSADPVATATLTIVADDVDGPGNGMNGEQDEVYINGHYVGLLNNMGYYTSWQYYPGSGNPDHPDAITTTTFTIDPAWLNSMPVEVVIEPSWGVEIETSTLTVVNNPPVANAGPDQTNVEQDSLGGANVALNGAGSYDPDGHPLTYLWTWTGDSATGVSPIVLLPLGTTTITLTVSDGGLTDTDTVDITVVDTTPPVITCPADVTVEQETADGTVVPLTATATDICDANPTIASDELAIYPLGMTTVTFTATDASGNSATCTTTVTVEDTTPPVPECLETVNPNGNKVPPAGSTTLPGPKGGQNEDGFYELTATDLCDPNPQIFVVDIGSGTVFGPFVSGTTIKYTQNLTATPEAKPIGSSKGRAGAIDWHIIGNGDATLEAVDSSGNVATESCLVPPPPK